MHINYRYNKFHIPIVPNKLADTISILQLEHNTDMNHWQALLLATEALMNWHVSLHYTQR